MAVRLYQTSVIIRKWLSLTAYPTPLHGLAAFLALLAMIVFLTGGRSSLPCQFTDDTTRDTPGLQLGGPAAMPQGIGFASERA